MRNINSMEISKIRKLPFFFILSRPRSGTTLLRTLLDSHPNISIPPEHGNLIHLYFKYGNKKGKWDKKLVDTLYKDFSSNHSVRTFWKIDESSTKEQLYVCASDNGTFKDFIKIIYANNQSFFSKGDINILGDKSPINSLYSGHLKQIFPDACFIHLVRDYRANLASMINFNVWSPSKTIIIMQWKKSVNQIESLSKQYPRQYFTIRYEDLVFQPEKSMIEVCDFLKVPYIPEILDPYKRNLAVEKTYNPEFINEFHPFLQKEISIENITNWKEKLSTREIKTADFLVEKSGEKFKYSKVNNKFSLVFRMFTFLKSMAFYNKELQQLIFDHLPYNWKIKIRNRKFILTREILILLKRLFGNK
jgi:hypothetical protein